MVFIIAQNQSKAFNIDKFYQFVPDTQKFLKEESYHLSIYEVSEEAVHPIVVFGDISDNYKIKVMDKNKKVFETKLIGIFRKDKNS